MTVEQAIILSDKITWGYNRAGKYTSHINSALLEHLGVKQYQIFCEKINGVNRNLVPPSQLNNFLFTYADNPNDVRSDFEITINWTLRQLFQTLSNL